MADAFTAGELQSCGPLTKIYGNYSHSDHKSGINGLFFFFGNMTYYWHACSLMIVYLATVCTDGKFSTFMLLQFEIIQKVFFSSLPDLGIFFAIIVLFLSI